MIKFLKKLWHVLNREPSFLKKLREDEYQGNELLGIK